MNPKIIHQKFGFQFCLPFPAKDIRTYNQNSIPCLKIPTGKKLIQNNSGLDGRPDSNLISNKKTFIRVNVQEFHQRLILKRIENDLVSLIAVNICILCLRKLSEINIPLQLVPEVGRAIGREGHVVMAVTDIQFVNMILGALASETEVGG